MANTAESQICHSTHSFHWRFGNKKTMTITCGEAGTVEDSLRRSDLFRKNEEKNKSKELVIVRGGRPIPSHFPCILIKPGEQLEVKYVNSKSAGEKVKHALKRDGRFLKTIFKKTCVLCDLTTNVEMSNLVDDLDDNTFTINILKKNSPPESQPSSLEDALNTFEQGNDNALEEVNNNALEQGNDNELEQGNNNALEQDNYNALEQGNNDENNTFIGDELLVREIQDSQEIRSHLSSRVRDLFGQEKEEHQILRVEYGRSQGSVTVESIKCAIVGH